MNHPDYVDRHGDIWRYGRDRQGDYGYRCMGGDAWSLDPDQPTNFEYARKEWDLRPVEEQFALLVSDREADGDTWVEGPYSEVDAMARRALLWDSGEYTISMHTYRKDGTT